MLTDAAIKSMSQWPPVSLPKDDGRTEIYMDKDTFENRLWEFR